MRVDGIKNNPDDLVSETIRDFFIEDILEEYKTFSWLHYILQNKKYLK